MRFLSPELHAELFRNLSELGMPDKTIKKYADIQDHLGIVDSIVSGIAHHAALTIHELAEARLANDDDGISRGRVFLMADTLILNVFFREIRARRLPSELFSRANRAIAQCRLV